MKSVFVLIRYPPTKKNRESRRHDQNIEGGGNVFLPPPEQRVGDGRPGKILSLFDDAPRTIFTFSAKDFKTRQMKTVGKCTTAQGLAIALDFNSM